MKNRAEWPDSCSQDMIYPTLAMNILCLGARALGPPWSPRKSRFRRLLTTEGQRRSRCQDRRV